MTTFRLNQVCKPLILTLLLTLGAVEALAQRAPSVHPNASSPATSSGCVASVAVGDWALRSNFSEAAPLRFDFFQVNRSRPNPMLDWLGLTPQVQLNCGRTFTVIDDITGATLMFDTFGNYSFVDCRKLRAPVLNGVGTAANGNCKTTLVDGPGRNLNRAVSAVVNTCTNAATATVAFGGATYQLSEANITRPNSPGCFSKN